MPQDALPLLQGLGVLASPDAVRLDPLPAFPDPAGPVRVAAHSPAVAMAARRAAAPFDRAV